MEKRWIRRLAIALAVVIAGGCDHANEATTEPVAESGQALYTNVYPVSPSFLTSRPRAPEPGQDHFIDSEPKDPLDPFLEAPKGLTAREFLEEHGVTFPPGASVISGGGSSALVIRNTEENLNRVEALIRSLNAEAEFSERRDLPPKP